MATNEDPSAEEGGWIYPPLKDRIVCDVRAGLLLGEICERQLCGEERVLGLVVRARANGFVSEAQAAAVMRDRT
jgi:hypothetical protein